MKRRYGWDVAATNNLPPLEVPCPECEGTGKGINVENREVWECFRCKGTGYVPTQDGMAVLSLVYAYGKAWFVPEDKM